MPVAQTHAQLEGFGPRDFDVFLIPEFVDRMEAIKERIRPKLSRIGELMAPELSHMLGVPIYPHVARHARRTVNPPQDTWVAFCANARGYKAHPHFQVGLWSDHLFIQFCLIDESPDRARFASNLRAHLDERVQNIPPEFRWSLDHHKPQGTLQREMDLTRFDLFLGKVEKLKSAEFLCGLDVPKDDPRVRDGKRLLALMKDTFQRLAPLYRLALS